MSRILLICFTWLAVASCNRQPYVECRVELEKKTNSCEELQSSFRLNSGFSGERYEFQKCLPSGYDKSLMISERRGDTVVVRFPLPASKSDPALYQVTLDVDSYPRYTFLTIDEETYTIIPSDK